MCLYELASHPLWLKWPVLCFHRVSSSLLRLCSSQQSLPPLEDMLRGTRGENIDNIGLSSSTACCKLTGHMQTRHIHFVLNHRITLGNLFTAVVAHFCTCDGFPLTHKSYRVMICVSDLCHHYAVCLVLSCSVAIPLLVPQDNCLCVCVLSLASGNRKRSYFALKSQCRDSSRFAVWLTAVVVCCCSGYAMHFTPPQRWRRPRRTLSSQ